MAKAGIWLNIIGTILITAVIMLLLPFVWGIDLSALPEWAANAILKQGG
jgi:sodium-dependent dicarboxylate transporter 2/3/5